MSEDTKTVLEALRRHRQSIINVLDYREEIHHRDRLIRARVKLARINAEIARRTYDQYGHFEWPVPLYKDGKLSGNYWACKDCPSIPLCVEQGCKNGF